MTPFEELAQRYAASDDRYQRRLYIAAALVNLDVDRFIDEYKEGWPDSVGSFAYDLACIRAVI